MEMGGDAAERRRAEALLQQSEQRYLAIIATAMDAILVLDRGHRIAVFNAAAERMFGYQAAAVLGQPLGMLLPERFRSEHRDLVEEFARTGKTGRGMGALGSVSARRATGAEFPIEVSISRTEAGGDHYLTAIVRDLTERLQAEEDLRVHLALQRLRNQVLEMGSQADWEDIVLGIHLELRGLVAFEYCSVQLVDLEDDSYVYFTSNTDPQAHILQQTTIRPVPSSLRRVVTTGTALYRRTRQEIEAFGDDVNPEVGCIVDVPFRGGTVAVNNRCEDAFGVREVRLLEQFAQVLSEAHLRLHEITVRQQLEAELEARRIQTIQADRLQSLGEMSTGIAHELNQPLASIRLLAEGLMLRMDMGLPFSPEGLRETLSGIDSQVERMSKIINHMRAFSRDDAKDGQVTFELNEVAKGTLAMIGTQLGSSGIQVAVDLPAVSPLCLGHPFRLEQVLLNLINNARDALEERQAVAEAAGEGKAGTWNPVLNLEVGRAPQDGQARLAVSDNGGGIPAEVVSRIFDPFFTTKEVGKGTGLGLAIVRSIVEAQQGRIEVDNRPGEGVTFSVVLPTVAGGQI